MVVMGLPNLKIQSTEKENREASTIEEETKGRVDDGKRRWSQDEVRSKQIY